MTVDTAPAAAPGATRGRRRIWVAVTVAALVALVVAVLLGGDEQYDAPYDPRNPGSDGAQAVAKVLEDEGVDVEIVRSADALADADADPDTTVVVTSSEQLAPSTIERLRTDAAAAAETVLVDPPFHVLDELEASPASVGVQGELGAECDDPRYDGLTLAVDDGTAYATAAGCFPSDDRHVLAVGASGLVYFGAGEALTNDQVLRADNAALALRLLGQTDRLLWYVPTFADADESEAVSLWTFAPDWLGPALWALLIAGIGLVWWRGRRFGPLATEPLPVVVRAVETARSRGRMYRRGNDRTYTAGALRAAARRELGDRLQLGRSASEREIVRAAAARLARPEHEIAALLASDSPAPTTDHELVRLAQELIELTREVRRG